MSLLEDLAEARSVILAAAHAETGVAEWLVLNATAFFQGVMRDVLDGQMSRLEAVLVRLEERGSEPTRVCPVYDRCAVEATTMCASAGSYRRNIQSQLRPPRRIAPPHSDRGQRAGRADVETGSNAPNL